MQSKLNQVYLVASVLLFTPNFHSLGSMVVLGWVSFLSKDFNNMGEAFSACIVNWSSSPTVKWSGIKAKGKQKLHDFHLVFGSGLDRYR